MKYLAGFYTLIAVMAIFLSPQVVLADNSVTVSDNGSTSNVSVHSQTQGSSTVCVNGKCTTSGGDGKSTVCVNGQCSTTDGNVDYQSEDGHTQIHVNNNTSGNTVTVFPAPSETNPSDTPEPTVSEEPTQTPDPTIAQMRKDINTHVEKEIEGVKEHMKDQNAAISSFMQSEMEALQNLFDNLFK